VTEVLFFFLEYAGELHIIALREGKGQNSLTTHTTHTTPEGVCSDYIRALENKEMITTITLIPALSQYGWQQPKH
jgi:hypothetical protein